MRREHLPVRPLHAPAAVDRDPRALAQPQGEGDATSASRGTERQEPRTDIVDPETERLAAGLLAAQVDRREQAIGRFERSRFVCTAKRSVPAWLGFAETSVLPFAVRILPVNPEAVLVRSRTETFR